MNKAQIEAAYRMAIIMNELGVIKNNMKNSNSEAYIADCKKAIKMYRDDLFNNIFPGLQFTEDQIDSIYFRFSDL